MRQFLTTPNYNGQELLANFTDQSLVQIYQIEDASLVNLVYFECVREQFATAVRELLASLGKYVAHKLNGSIKGARLGFSSEKEMFNICNKLFVQLSTSQRQLLSYLWNTIQVYRFVQHLNHQNETPPCFQQHPTPKLIAH